MSILFTHDVPGDFDRALVGLGGIGGILSGGEEAASPLVGRDGIGGGPLSSMTETLRGTGWG